MKAIEKDIREHIFSRPVVVLKKINLGGSTDEKYQVILDNGLTYLVRVIENVYAKEINFEKQMRNQAAAVGALQVMQRPLMVYHGEKYDYFVQEWVFGAPLHEIFQNAMAKDVAKKIVRLWKKLNKVEVSAEDVLAAKRKIGERVTYLREHWNELYDDEKLWLGKFLELAEKRGSLRNLTYGFCHGDFFIANFVAVRLENARAELCPIDFTKCGVDYEMKDLAKLFVFNVGNFAFSLELLKQIKSLVAYNKKRWNNFLDCVIVYCLVATAHNLMVRREYFRGLVLNLRLVWELLFVRNGEGLAE